MCVFLQFLRVYEYYVQLNRPGFHIEYLKIETRRSSHFIIYNFVTLLFWYSYTTCFKSWPGRITVTFKAFYFRLSFSYVTQ